MKTRGHASSLSSDWGHRASIVVELLVGEEGSCLLLWLARAEGWSCQAEDDVVGLPVVALQLHAPCHMVPSSHRKGLLQHAP